jgi:DNA-binding transcriptional ArsR family regulator
MPNQSSAQLDLVFRALCDPTRRAVLERLATGPGATIDLAEPFAMALPSFTQHLEVLERCDLVSSEKNGRVRTYRLTPAAMRPAETWMTRQRSLWEKRLDQLDTHLRNMKDKR